MIGPVIIGELSGELAGFGVIFAGPLFSVVLFDGFVQADNASHTRPIRTKTTRMPMPESFLRLSSPVNHDRQRRSVSLCPSADAKKALAVSRDSITVTLCPSHRQEIEERSGNVWLKSAPSLHFHGHPLTSQSQRSGYLTEVTILPARLVDAVFRFAAI